MWFGRTDDTGVTADDRDATADDRDATAKIPSLGSPGRISQLYRTVVAAAHALRVISFALIVGASMLTIVSAGLVTFVHNSDASVADHAKVGSLCLSLAACAVVSLMLLLRPYRLRQRCTILLLLLSYYSYLDSSSFIAAEDERKAHLAALESRIQNHLQDLTRTLALVQAIILPKPRADTDRPLSGLL
jgi:hypothetical protein